MNSQNDHVQWSNEGQIRRMKMCLKFTNVLYCASYEKYGLIQCILKIKREFFNVYRCIPRITPEPPQIHKHKKTNKL